MQLSVEKQKRDTHIQQLSGVKRRRRGFSGIPGAALNQCSHARPNRRRSDPFYCLQIHPDVFFFCFFLTCSDRSERLTQGGAEQRIRSGHCSAGHDKKEAKPR